MNLFMHYCFDRWMRSTYSHCLFARYADDAVVHCWSEPQAKHPVIDALGVATALELCLWTVRGTRDFTIGTVFRPPCASGGGVDAGLTAGAVRRVKRCASSSAKRRSCTANKG